MRWLPILAVLAGVAGAEPRASNPAFVGVGLDDVPPMGCAVNRVVSGAPAKDAGLHVGDLMLAVDGTPLVDGSAAQPCSVFQKIVASHAPGDTIKIDARRGLDALAISVTLATRAEVAHRQFVGHRLTVTLSDADDPSRTRDVDDLGGHAAVLGLFHADGCIGCSAVFDRLRDGLRERLAADDQPELFAVTPEIKDPQAPQPSPRPLPQIPPPTPQHMPLSKLFSSSVPLMTAPADLFLQGELFEADRIYFLIVDSRGIVRCVTPIAPDADDLDAALDEVLAAVEQEQHASRSRR